MTALDARVGAAVSPRPPRTARQVVSGYVALTKPRIIELLLVTTVPTMLLAEGGIPSLWLVAATLVGGTLAAGSANTLNCYLDRDIDQVMHRTERRPLATGLVGPREALVFGIVLGALAVGWFLLTVGSLPAVLALAAIAFYVGVYTLALKRRTPQNIVWGGAAGCMPVFIGWASVTNSLSWTPVLLFLIIFLWTPPHYWPLSMKFRKDYANAGVPMLPVVASAGRVAGEMIAYAIAMVAVSLLLVPVAGMTWIYAGVALGFGVWFVAGCVAFRRRIREGRKKLGEMRLFRDSILYLTAVFAAILADPFWPDALTVWQP